MDGEREGWRPSLIISPMVVEDGRALLISNLRLTDLSGGMEFFRLFPAARSIKLSTALRMNAAFPYVTPAVNLPTQPPRRVVDAGYLDNYGVGLAADWLMRHRDWLKQHTSRVILIQIRAYPLDLDKPSRSPLEEAVRNAFQPLTAPPEGYSAGRWAAMRDYTRREWTPSRRHSTPTGRDSRSSGRSSWNARRSLR